jgi:hypothetical protein
MRPGSSLRLVLAAPMLLFVGACSSETPSSAGGTAGTSVIPGTAGTGIAGQMSTAGSTALGSGGMAGTGTGGVTSTAGAIAMAGTAGVTGTAGAIGTAGTGGEASDTDPPAPRPINVTPGGGCNCDLNTGGGKAKVDTTKPIQGKLVITLPGICGGPGGGGLEGTVIALGFHVFQPQTQSCVNSAPDKYKQMLQANPLDPEANRQVGDARMELWDGVDRVDWVTVNKGESIAERTLAAIKAGMTQDPGGDWGYYLNTDGSVRWSDVFIMGYSWGAQSAAMIASYVRFGRVFCASGPQAEQFPNADWITHTWATPADRLFMIVGFNEPYPSMDKVDIAPNTVTSMIDTVTKAGWIGPPVNVLPGDKGPYTGKHLFAAVAKFPYDQHAPGGHGIYCNNDPLSGWAAMCSYILLGK